MHSLYNMNHLSFSYRALKMSRKISNKYFLDLMKKGMMDLYFLIIDKNVIKITARLRILLQSKFSSISKLFIPLEMAPGKNNYIYKVNGRKPNCGILPVLFKCVPWSL